MSGSLVLLQGSCNGLCACRLGGFRVLGARAVVLKGFKASACVGSGTSRCLQSRLEILSATLITSSLSPEEKKNTAQCSVPGPRP